MHSFVWVKYIDLVALMAHHTAAAEGATGMYIKYIKHAVSTPICMYAIYLCYICMFHPARALGLAL